MLDIVKNLWFRDTKEQAIYINEVAMRIRAGILLMIPLYMGLTLFDVVYTSSWVVDGNTAVDTYDTNWDDQIIYQVEAVKRTYDYTVQTWILFYGLFEMIAGMFVRTSRFSPTIYLATFLARKTPPVWKPLVPKRFAWGIGATFITVCLMFFNPDTVAGWVNSIAGTPLLSETENFIPYWIPVNLVWVCMGFMWLEAILGYCVGCKVHAMLVWMGVFKEECEECNNIDWDEIARKHKEKQQAENPAN
ncbi:DUF4395 domain-containing protein [Thiomicrorhabdus lithotrophica]|uniref:DUF4395 domain-containing protein n=1 Tax=Thiomicrorhabdus lithotrophica TaxID=2949997 RepID=A0ABY8C768_9GAMM|nr:DUF4395 domain-containing protein [Thiomicrorhabdus lithotrophica]WEJ61811.1 DUF4395 domain-containing protein [Thiomicrorhabdus lithotrophica]